MVTASSKNHLMPEREDYIAKQGEQNRTDYASALKKTDNKIQHWIKSSSFEMIICILSLLAFICNQILIYYLFFKDDVGILKENFARSIVSSNDLIWTIFASLSISIEIIFHFETVIRMILIKGFWKDPPLVIEGIIVIFYPVPRLVLPVRISLILDLCILLRCWRLYRILENAISFEKDLLYFTLNNMIGEKDHLDLFYRQKLEKAQNELKETNLKLDKALG
jgi:hypothetical protein